MFKRLLSVAALVLAVSPAHAAVLNFTSVLNGEKERPAPVQTDALGFASVELDTVAETVGVSLLVSGITKAGLSDAFKSALFGGVLGPIHIHLGGAEASGPVVLPFVFDNTYMDAAGGFKLRVEDLKFATANAVAAGTPVGITQTFEDFASAASAGNLYFNVHTNAFPGGEIRGQLDPVAPVPLPASALLLLGGVGGMLTLRRKQRA